MFGAGTNADFLVGPSKIPIDVKAPKSPVLNPSTGEPVFRFNNEDNVVSVIEKFRKPKFASQAGFVVLDTTYLTDSHRDQLINDLKLRLSDDELSRLIELTIEEPIITQRSFKRPIRKAT